jgi:hypothetical protein
LAEVLKTILALGAFAERPEVREFLAGDAAAAIRYSDDDVLLGFAYCDFDGRGRRGRVVGLFLVALDDSLDGVAQELTDNVFEVAEDVGEARAEVAIDFDLGHLYSWGVCSAGELSDGFGAAAYDVLGRAFYEDFADKVGLGELGAGREVGRVESFCKGEVLLRDDPSRDALRGFEVSFGLSSTERKEGGTY